MAFAKVREAVAAKLDPHNLLDLEDLVGDLLPHVPESFTLVELDEDTRPRLEQNPQVEILTIWASLKARNQRRIAYAAEDELARQGLSSLVGKMLAPVYRRDQDGDAEAIEEDRHATAQHAAVVRRLDQVARWGVLVLKLLTADTTRPENEDDSLRQAPLPEALLVTLAALTDDELVADPGTRATALQFLDAQLNVDTAGNKRRHLFIVDAVLKTYLRRLFSKSRPPTITASGRKAAFPEQNHNLQRLPTYDELRETKPWKYEDMGAIPVVAWVVDAINGSLLAANWPLFVPVILAFVDDPSTRIRARGLTILTRFLAKFSPSLLQTTGLTTVLESAVLPTLMYIPSLTPESESLKLLGPAYGALFALLDKFPPDSADSERRRLLDSMMRNGILAACDHVGNHVRIVKIIMEQAVMVVQRLGIYSSKYLKDLVPLLVTLLSDPLGPNAPDTLIATMVTLQTVLANCWPRLARETGTSWYDAMLNALIVSWINVADNGHCSSEAVHMMQAELIKTARMLAAITPGGREGVAKAVAPLIEREPALLRGLFQGPQQQPETARKTAWTDSN